MTSPASCARLVIAVCLVVRAGAARLPFRQPVFMDENSLSPVAKYGGPTVYKALDWVRIKHSGPRMSRVSPGGRQELECEANGSPPPTIQWYFNGNPISQGLDESNSIGGLRLGSMKSRLVLDCVTPRHQGSYTCVASAGSDTEVSQPSLLLVQGNNVSGQVTPCSQTVMPPHILTWSPNTMETIGNDALLPCLAAGSPTPQVYWLDSQNNLISSGSESNSDDRFKVLDSGDLMISTVLWTDMGQYTCVAESPLGRDSVTTFLYPMAKDR